MSLVSHAQNFEDVRLYRALRDVEHGRYIDIGAQDPDHLSVSQAFFDLGWTGIHVEPVAEYAQKLEYARAGDLVIPAVVGRGKTTAFHVFKGTGLSTRDAALAQLQSETRTQDIRQISVLPLSEIFAKSSEPIHWLKIDVEGSEGDVLRSWGVSPARPWVICIEAIDPITRAQNHSTWENELTSRDYIFAAFDGLNRFYVHGSHPERLEAFTTPPNVFDAFELGRGSGFTAAIELELENLRKMHSLANENLTVANEDLGVANEAVDQLSNRLKTDLAKSQAQAEVISGKYDALVVKFNAETARADLAVQNLDNASVRAVELSNYATSLTSRLSDAELRAKSISEDYDALVVRFNAEATRADIATQKLEAAEHALQHARNERDAMAIKTKRLAVIRNEADQKILSNFVRDIKREHQDHLNTQESLFANERRHFKDTLHLALTHQAAALDELARVKADADALRNSTFWRLTAPARRVLTFISNPKSGARRFSVRYVSGRVADKILSAWRQDIPALRPLRAFINRRRALAGRLSGLAQSRDAVTDYGPLIATKNETGILTADAQSSQDWTRQLSRVSRQPRRGA